MNKFKKERGFVAIDAALGTTILIILSGLVIVLVLNVYNTNISMHRSSMATDYTVEILENAKLLNYYDTKLIEGTYEGNNILGVNLGNNYNARLVVQDYNKIEGNEDKKDLIKILELTLEYTDGNLNKNIKVSTLKINK